LGLGCRTHACEKRESWFGASLDDCTSAREAAPRAAEDALTPVAGVTAQMVAERDGCHGGGNSGKGHHETYEKDLVPDA
jgi:hypothetical protein